MNAQQTSLDDDKTGDALKAQRFQMLEDIASELAGEVVFPTHFDAVLRLRKVLHDPEQPLSVIAGAIAVEPLISAKLLYLANSAAFNPGAGKSSICNRPLPGLASTPCAVPPCPSS